MNCQSHCGADENSHAVLCGKPAVHHWVIQRRDGGRETTPFKVPYVLAWCGDCCDGTFDKEAVGYNDTDSQFTCDPITPEEAIVFQIMES